MSSYYEEELKHVIPIDKYGLHVKFRNTTGETKWFMINQESLPVLKKFLNRLVPSSEPGDCSIRVKGAA